MFLKFVSIILIVSAVTTTYAKDTATKKAAEGLPEMRHGWTVVTGPQRNLDGVNNNESIEKGRVLYQMNCVACHGEKGEGDGKMAKEFGIHPANLKELSAKYPNHFLVIQINDGKGDMPKWRDLLNPQQTWDLSNFIQSLAGDKKN